MGCKVEVPGDYDPNGWDGDCWSYEEPEGLDIGEEFCSRVVRIVNAKPKLEELTNERLKAATGATYSCSVNGTFKVLNSAGFDFGKDWEDQPQDFHTKLVEKIDDLIGLLRNHDPRKRQESKHWIAHPALEPPDQFGAGMTQSNETIGVSENLAPASSASYPNG
jgi:hypothetical protein